MSGVTRDDGHTGLIYPAVQVPYTSLFTEFLCFLSNEANPDSTCCVRWCDTAQLHTLTTAGSRAPPLAVGRLYSLHAAVAPRRDRAPVVGLHVWMVGASRQPRGSECKPKWIWAADWSVDCCCTEAVDSSCKAALTLRNISWFRTEGFGFCPNVAPSPTIRSGFLV